MNEPIRFQQVLDALHRFLAPTAYPVLPTGALVTRRMEELAEDRYGLMREDCPEDEVVQEIRG